LKTKNSNNTTIKSSELRQNEAEEWKQEKKQKNTRRGGLQKKPFEFTGKSSGKLKSYN